MNKIETIMVDSSAIYSAEYNTKQQEIIVYFNNESIYKYHNVPTFIWRGLFDSDSKGKFLNKYIFKKFTDNRLD